MTNTYSESVQDYDGRLSGAYCLGCAVIWAGRVCSACGYFHILKKYQASAGYTLSSYRKPTWFSLQTELPQCYLLWFFFFFQVGHFESTRWPWHREWIVNWQEMLLDIIGYKISPETGSLQVIRLQIPGTLYDVHHALNTVFYLVCILSVERC